VKVLGCFRRKRHIAPAISARLGLLFADLIIIVSALVMAYYVRFNLLASLVPRESFFALSLGIYIENYAGSIVFGAALPSDHVYDVLPLGGRTLIRISSVGFLALVLVTFGAAA
jgi:hypothetical protein